jgi:hypothetical protein
MLRMAFTVGAASAALTACTDQPTSVPAVRHVAGVSAYVLPACNFTTLRDAVRAYVGVNGSDSIYTYIRDMSIAPYEHGMNGLARLAQIRADGPKASGATAAQGAAAVMAFLACMPVDTVQDGFATNIVSAMGPGGMFEVPTTSSTDAVYSRGETGAYYWAAKPDSGDTWGGLSNGQRFLVFGYEINNETGFDYNVIPMLGHAGMPPQFADSLVIGACGTFDSAIRVNHDGEILFDENMLPVCAPGAPTLASLSSGFGGHVASVVRRSLSVFAPQPAFAFGGGVGGAVSELSPTTLPTVTPAIAYTQQPLPTPLVGQPLGVMVSVFSGATPLKDAQVTLTITGNSGLNALFLDPEPDPEVRCHFVTRSTDKDGVADFSDVPLLKAGGYTLTASAVFDGLQATPVPSDPINVKNAKYNAPKATC